MTSALTYRPEIDGLRAVAVMPVILFHAGFSVFSGGYVGVDIFFVISGYLITAILISDLEKGDFSIPRFYERRARRILPALFLVILCCLPFAWKWMFPAELKDFSQSIIAVIFFASNILFWREDDYFAASAETKPLLHTWSLAVEEQYYLIFPIFLVLVWRFGRHRVFWMICAAAACSLLLSEWGWRNAPKANFYLAPSRAWELLTGSICAFRLSGHDVRPNNVLSITGLGLIVFAVFAFDDATPFPSLYALAPVLGAALIILYGPQGTLTATLLSTPVLVGIGLISYSAYLWHQPLFAFARIRSIAEPAPILMLALVATSLVLAYLSWRFVEKPFRKDHASILPNRASVFVASGTAAAAFFAIGLSGYLLDGIATRTTPSGITFQEAFNAESLALNYGLSSDCERIFTLSENCRTNAEPDAILWGDSYAMHLAGAILASPTKISLVQHTKSQCAPVIDIATIGTVSPWRECLWFNDQVLSYIKNNKSAKYVIISTPLSLLDPRSTIYSRNGRSDSNNQYETVKDKFIKTSRIIESYGKTLVIVSPTPRNNTDIGQCLMRSTAFNAPLESCNFSHDEAISNFPQNYDFLRDISKSIPVILLDDFICTNKVCNAALDGTLIYRDAGHLSIKGARLIGQRYDLAQKIMAAAEK